MGKRINTDNGSSVTAERYYDHPDGRTRICFPDGQVIFGIFENGQLKELDYNHSYLSEVNGCPDVQLKAIWEKALQLENDYYHGNSFLKSMNTFTEDFKHFLLNHPRQEGTLDFHIDGIYHHNRKIFYYTGPIRNAEDLKVLTDFIVERKSDETIFFTKAGPYSVSFIKSK